MSHYADGTACYSMACTTKHGELATCPSRCPLCLACYGPAPEGSECNGCRSTLGRMARWGSALKAAGRAIQRAIGGT